jgi:membrane protease YdiL (CAAX protease family)
LFVPFRKCPLFAARSTVSFPDDDVSGADTRPTVLFTYIVYGTMGVRNRVPVEQWAPPSGGLGVVTVTVCGPLLGVALSRLVGVLPSTVGPLSRLTAGVVLYGLGLGVAALGYLALTGQLGDLSGGSTDAPRLRLAALATAGLVAAWVVTVGGLTTLGVPFAGNALTSTAERGVRASLLLLAALSLLVIAPAEELLYRGAVQASLYDLTSRPWAVVLSSVPFTLIHVPTLYADTAEPSAVGLSLVGVFGLSLVFGWLHARTDDLLVPVAVHGAYNAAVFCLIYLTGI